MAKKRIYLSLDPDIKEFAEKYAERNRTSISALVNRWFFEIMKKEESPIMTETKFAEMLGFEEFEGLVHESETVFDEGNISFFITELKNGKFAAWDNAELARDRVEYFDTYEEALDSLHVGCAYCSADIPVKVASEVPDVDDDDAWEELKKHHTADCEWIETRAHQRINYKLGN